MATRRRQINVARTLAKVREDPLEHQLCAELDLTRVKRRYGSARLGKRVVGFANINAVEQVEDIHAQPQLPLIAKGETAGETEIE